MANLRRSITAQQDLSPAASSRKRGQRRIRAGVRARWALVAGAAALALLALAWVDGGEEPLRPIVEPVALPEQQP